MEYLEWCMAQSKHAINTSHYYHHDYMTRHWMYTKMYAHLFLLPFY